MNLERKDLSVILFACLHSFQLQSTGSICLLCCCSRATEADGHVHGRWHGQAGSLPPCSPERKMATAGMRWVERLTLVVLKEIAYLRAPVFLE